MSRPLGPMFAPTPWLRDTVERLLGLSLAAVLAAGCGGAEKPEPRTAAAHADSRPVDRTSSVGAMGDSALEPAAAEALKAEDFPRAETLYRELARRQPRNPAGKRGLGAALIKQDKLEPATEALQGSLELGDNLETRLLLASAFGGLNRYPSALPHLRKAVKMAPGNPAPWAKLAEALVKVEKPDGAADTLTESKQGCSKCESDEEWGRAADSVAEALCAKAEKQLAANDAAGARKTIDAATALRPDVGAAHLTKARLAKADGDRKAAIGEYRKAVDGVSDAQSESGFGARLELATLLVADGNGDEAAKLARAAAGARSGNGPALDTLGRACDLTKDVPCARDAYDQLTKLSPGSDGVTRESVDHAKQRLKVLKKAPKGKGKKKKR